MSPGRWAECLSCAGGELKVALLLQNNTVETYSVKASDASKTARLTLGGHRTDVRTLAFSSDNLAVLSASGDTVKIWNRSEGGGGRKSWCWIFYEPVARGAALTARLRVFQVHPAGDPDHGLPVRPLLHVRARGQTGHRGDQGTRTQEHLTYFQTVDADV